MEQQSSKDLLLLLGWMHAVFSEYVLRLINQCVPFDVCRGWQNRKVYSKLCI